MGGVDDRRVRPETALAAEQLDRPEPVLAQALLDLARLLVRVDVKGKSFGGGVATELTQRVRGAGADGVGGDADRDSLRAQCLELGEVAGDGRLPEAGDPSAEIARVKADERDAGLSRGLRRGARLLEPEVVELTDRRVAVRPKLAVDLDVIRSD